MEDSLKNLIHNLKTPLSTIDIAINTTLQIMKSQPKLTNEQINSVSKLLNNANIANQDIKAELKGMLITLQGEK